MHILFLTQIVPYPPDAGPKIKTWHVIRYLIECGHQVTLASFMRPDEEEFVAMLRRVCDAVYAVPIRRSRSRDIFYWARSNVTGRPFLVERDDLIEMKNMVEKLLATNTIDVIHADQLTMAQYGLHSNELFTRNRRPSLMEDIPQNTLGNQNSGFHHPPAMIFDAHNAVWTILERMRQNAPWFLKPVISMESRRMKRYEGIIVRSFDHTLAVTETDRQALLEAASLTSNKTDLNNKPITVIPIAVDTEQLQPVQRMPGSVNILTLGTLHYPPNADGIRWFLREVFPLIRLQIPQATITVIGKNPPRNLIQLADQAPRSITFTGYVNDLVPFLQKAGLIVVPVRAGGGMRVRILEAFARAVPVVTTSIGLEGIQAEPEEDVLVQDTPEGYAQAVVNLLLDETLQARLSKNGRSLVERIYDWQVVLKDLGALYTTIEKEPRKMRQG